jgi:stage V sporulation protein SpoVS
VVLAGGVNAINQAVKGIAALRAQIQKESGGRKDITASASYRDEEKNSVSFIVSRCRGEAEPEFRELKVAGKSEIPSVAGSIAHGVRKGDEIALITMGPLACSSGIGAIILARGYLKKEDVAVSFRPAIVTIESGRADNEMVTALKLAVYSTESQK